MSNNPILSEYKIYLKQRFKITDNFDEFIQIISEELKKYGINDWSYSSLDVPDEFTASEPIGNIDSTVTKHYMDQSLYAYDMLLEHVNSSNRYIFQSDIEFYISQSPLSSRQMEGHMKIVELNRAFGHGDVLGIPITSLIDNSRILFSLTSNGGYADKFKTFTKNKLPKFVVIAECINEVGVSNFPDIFLSSVKRYQSIINSEPFNLLATMFKYDLTVPEAAKKLNITRCTASKHLGKIRSLFNVNSNHGALRYALSQGFLQYKD